MYILYVYYTYLSMCFTHILYNKIMEFGKNFKICRKNAKLSQKQVAGYFNIHQSNVSDWENDISRPEYEKLFELCKLYDVTLCELLGVEDLVCKN